MRSFAAILAVALLAAAAVAEVTVLTPDTFDTVVGSNKAVFVKFFAPWCGHCKKLAPDWVKLSEEFAKSNKVIIAEVDCDAHKDLCGRFEVHGFPTLKFFPKSSSTAEDYKGARSVDEFKTFLDGKGIKSSSAPTFVVSLTTPTFNKIVMDPSKNVLVKFFAPWCGHCKALKPDYEKVAGIFANDDNVVMAELDCDAAENKDICSTYGVTGFPTLKFFPAGSAEKKAEDYEGGRAVSDLLSFLNTKAGLSRLETGRLNDKAGRIEALDTLAKTFLAAEDKAAILAKAKEQKEVAKSAKYYIKTMEAVMEKGAEFITKEKARLQRVLDGNSLSAKKIDEFTIRMNVLAAF